MAMKVHKPIENAFFKPPPKPKGPRPLKKQRDLFPGEAELLHMPFKERMRALGRCRTCGAVSELKADGSPSNNCARHKAMDAERHKRFRAS